MPSNTWVVVAVVCLLVFLLGRSPRQSLKDRLVPPGPRRLPLLGNAHQLPLEYQEYTFGTWAKKYGDLIYAEFFGSRTIIINSSKIARDLLDKRGAIYSSRPRLVTFVELIGWDPTLVFALYQHESRRRQRRWVQAAFGEKDTIRQYEGLQHREVCIFLSSLIQTPKDFTMHITRYVTMFTVALILGSVYGHRITSLEDEYVTLMDRGMEATSATGPAGGGMVDYFPLCAMNGPCSRTWCYSGNSHRASPPYSLVWPSPWTSNAHGHTSQDFHTSRGMRVFPYTLSQLTYSNTAPGTR
ncbi:cytochrome P450 [Fomitopsis serialis]|uniref:cytochrome P450 n=1 Tax=Fomitopsis serialis TaxID=139415 RepID=UPI00200793CE|nr:cytochrome P450 [Neoantrodia serialis]KAH9929319.1 cytochrome P450 [Neoantrodia serialis]